MDVRFSKIKMLGGGISILPFVPTYDADGNATLIRTSTGTWRITYNGANRPVRFRNEETDTTVDCGYDSQGRPLLQKSNGRGNGNVASSLHLSRLFADCVRGLHTLRASCAMARDVGSVSADGDASARDSKRRHVVHLRLRHHQKHLRSLRSRRLHPHVLQLRSVRGRNGIRRCLPTLPMVLGALRLRTRPRLLQLPPLLALARSLPLPRPHRRTRRPKPLRLREKCTNKNN